MAKTLSYTDNEGDAKTFPVQICAQHFFNHKTHHRGQVSTLLSQMNLDIGVNNLPYLPSQSNKAGSLWIHGHPDLAEIGSDQVVLANPVVQSSGVAPFDVCCWI